MKHLLRAALCALLPLSYAAAAIDEPFEAALDADGIMRERIEEVAKHSRETGLSYRENDYVYIEKAIDDAQSAWEGLRKVTNEDEAKKIKKRFMPYSDVCDVLYPGRRPRNQSLIIKLFLRFTAEGEPSKIERYLRTVSHRTGFKLIGATLCVAIKHLEEEIKSFLSLRQSHLGEGAFLVEDALAHLWDTLEDIRTLLRAFEDGECPYRMACDLEFYRDLKALLEKQPGCGAGAEHVGSGILPAEGAIAIIEDILETEEPEDE